MEAYNKQYKTNIFVLCQQILLDQMIIITFKFLFFPALSKSSQCKIKSKKYWGLGFESHLGINFCGWLLTHVAFYE